MFRVIGALLIIIGCSTVGRVKNIADKRTIRLVEEFIRALQMMICELEFHRIPLPDLCLFVSERTDGAISVYFSVLEEELSDQTMPDVRCCSDVAIKKCCDIPTQMKALFNLMAESLGMFGVAGQVEQLRYVKHAAENLLESIHKRYEQHGRSVQTLWVCAGVTLAVILI